MSIIFLFFKEGTVSFYVDFTGRSRLQSRSFCDSAVLIQAGMKGPAPPPPRVRVSDAPLTGADRKSGHVCLRHLDTQFVKVLGTNKHDCGGHTQSTFIKRAPLGCWTHVIRAVGPSWVRYWTWCWCGWNSPDSSRRWHQFEYNPHLPSPGPIPEPCYDG